MAGVCMIPSGFPAFLEIVMWTPTTRKQHTRPAASDSAVSRRIHSQSDGNNGRPKLFTYSSSFVLPPQPARIRHGRSLNGRRRGARTRHADRQLHDLPGNIGGADADTRGDPPSSSVARLSRSEIRGLAHHSPNSVRSVRTLPPQCSGSNPS